MTRNESYSNDLAGFSMEALQPAANGGAKLTKDQILAGFGRGNSKLCFATVFFITKFLI